MLKSRKPPCSPNSLVVLKYIFDLNPGSRDPTIPFSFSPKKGGEGALPLPSSIHDARKARATANIAANRMAAGLICKKNNNNDHGCERPVTFCCGAKYREEGRGGGSTGDRQEDLAVRRSRRRDGSTEGQLKQAGKQPTYDQAVAHPRMAGRRF